MEAFETADVKKGDFFALMFFVVALANLVLYMVAGWIANVMAQVSLPAVYISSIKRKEKLTR